ncbi:glutathione peroxidase [Paenibacillus sacheonensis]|uniref:Glutathione peroxidase n=1 Tax=Paenibacillus sacheonensis TaxID=742054 RepID=A0A7X4YVX4_9BACL|nr:glutathione peroxidase [Paenibacillus sacheonensis]MBM7568873.1 glutathione peroxidase [Paenibacillus sacheonensis]NBC72576.1 glutathione peroxidase [Paenibacillus sacheonensis]
MSIYSYEVESADHGIIPLSDYRGKVLLIVNTASRCGYSKHFAGLQRLYDTYREQGFELLGFPCNQFNAKEPDSDAELRAYCEDTFGITFPFAAKTEVTGPRAHPLFAYLTGELPFEGFDLSTENGRWMDSFVQTKYPELYGGNCIKWNFTKLLIGRDGRPAARFETPVEPEELAPAIETFLKK